MSELSGKCQPEGKERIARIQAAVQASNLDAIVCTLPSYVLMLSGHWPVIGTAIAVATREGEIALLVPNDEVQFTGPSWAHRIRTFSPGSLETITTPALAAGEPLKELLHDLKVHCARIGYEYGAASEPATYAGMNLYGSDMVDILRFAVPSAALAPASEALAQLAASKTQPEVARVRLSCQIAGKAFEQGRAQVEAGRLETEVAAVYREGFSVFGMATPGVLRADGFAWCMSGPNSDKAKAAFAYSSGRKLQPGDFVLIHANSYADGYWTDITRNQVVGEPDDRQRKIFAAISEARDASFAAIRPGARAADVDHAGRDVLRKLGFEKQFPHSTGHGVGFAAISANARPRIHPASDEVLETGMTFNVEPAIYYEGYGGARHCDLVTVTDNGMELLTDFQNEIG